MYNTGFQDGLNRELKLIDLKMSLVVACHTSIRAIDHIGETLRTLGKGSKLSELKLHRTKCSKLLSKVVAPCMLKDLVTDIGNSYFSVICDESTDISTHKQFALCIRYYSYKKSL